MVDDITEGAPDAPDPSWWRRWEFELGTREVSEPAMAAMRARPGFDQAVEYVVRGAMRLSDGEARFHRIMNDTAAMLMGVTALHLDATGGLTHRRLREAAGVTGVLSAGRISALLMRMQMIGYVHAASSHVPGTPKVYRPTPEMTATFKARYRLDLEAMRFLAPGMDEVIARYDTAEGFRAFMAVFGEVLLRAVRDRPPPREPMLWIAARRGGGMLMFALLEAASDGVGRFPSPGPVALSVAALSRRFRVSRAQIVTLLRKTVEAGYFTRGATEGEGEVQPALVEDMEKAIAAALIAVDASAHRSLSGAAAAAAA